MKYDAFFIFLDTICPTYPENQDTKEGFFFSLNQRIKTKFFLAVNSKNYFNMMHISFLLKQLCSCCLNIRFFSLILLAVSFCNSVQLYVFLFPCIDTQRIVLQLLKVALNLSIIINYNAVPYLI